MSCYCYADRLSTPRPGNQVQSKRCQSPACAGSPREPQHDMNLSPVRPVDELNSTVSLYSGAILKISPTLDLDLATEEGIPPTKEI